MRAVRYDDYGDTSVLRLAELPEPAAEPGHVIVQVRATGINPAETKIRGGIMRSFSPLTFPASQGSEFSGTVAAVGEGATRWSVGDAVVGWSREHMAQAQLVAVSSADITAKPATVSFEEAGACVVVGCTAWAAMESIAPVPDEATIVTGAGGGIGSVVVQLMRRRGAQVVGIAAQRHHQWLRELGAMPVAPGPDLEVRLRNTVPFEINTFVDTVGEGYVELALGLGVAPDRVHTVIDFPAVERYGVKGGAASASIEVIEQLLEMLAAGTLTIRVAASFPLDRVREAYELLASGHPGGKIVLTP